MLKRELSFINENQSLYCENIFLITREHVEFDERKFKFVLFLVVYHILSETVPWPFLWLLRMNKSEMQHKDDWTKELNILLL